MEGTELLHQIRAELGLSHRRARRALDAVAVCVGSSLSPAGRDALAVAAPFLRPLVVRTGARVALPRAAMVSVVADAIGEPLGRALETTQVVCRALAEHLAPEVCAQLDAELEPDVAGMFARREAAEAPEPVAHPRSRYQGVAGGRPGSRRSLSDSPAFAHRDSLAQSDEPHAATKLSSSPGTSSERAAETIASGRPGSRYPLAEGEE